MSETISPQETACAILSGGIGSRLQSVVADKPKALAPVAGRPFLTYILDQLIHSGFKKVVLCTGYKAELLEKELGFRYKSLTLEYSSEDKPLGTGGALRLALPKLHSHFILVMNGDSFIEENLGEFIAWFEKKAGNHALIGKHLEDASRFGRVCCNSRGEIVRFEEKKPGASSGLINAGIYLLRRQIFEELPLNKTFSLEREIFPKLVGAGFFAYPSNKRFIDIGVPDSFREAQLFFKKFSMNSV